jgi:hypothetical protein
MYVETYLPTCKPSTAANYPYIIERWLRPKLGNVPSGSRLRQGPRDSERVRINGNTEASVRSTGTVLRSILRFAIDRKLIPELPSSPSCHLSAGPFCLRIRTWKYAMIAAAKRSEHRIAIMLAAFAGLRTCEIRGLRGGDIYPSRRVR